MAGWVKEVAAKKKDLGYLPIWNVGQSPLPLLGPCVDVYGHHSAGNQMDAMVAAIGSSVQGNTSIDAHNSKLIILWSNDPKSSQAHLSFRLTKAKENGAAIVVVDPRYTDSAATMATGIKDVPGWIAIRPATDTAMLSAMANVIYRKKLHDEDFIKKYCFGFYPGDEVVSDSPMKDPVTGAPFKGQKFNVPEGQSFVEYLDSLEKEHGGYDGVLKWASKLTGAPAKVIESFAVQYATVKPAAVWGGWTSGGAQRNNAGMFYSWLIIAISAMTGNITRRGGGIGMVSPSDGYKPKLGPQPAVSKTKAARPILVSRYNTSEVLLTGRDTRTAEQLRADVLTMNKIDLGADPRIQIDMIFRGGGSVDEFNQRSSINKKRLAWKKPKYVVSYEWVMSSTAAWSDIILPAAMNLEQSFFTFGQIGANLDVVNKVIEPMYESKPDWQINEMLAKRLGIEYGRNGLSDIDIMKKQWEKATMPEAYKAIDPAAKLPSFDEIIQNAQLLLPTPVDKTFVHAATFAPGKFQTDTGKINFYSPYYARRQRVTAKVYRPQYIRPFEGYEDILEGKKGVKGVKYGLQFVTPHLLPRAHSSFDNVPILKDLMPHAVEMHPLDAQKRGIKDGQIVYVYNDMGCIKLPARITKRIIPGVVCIGHGVWYRPSLTETYKAWYDSDGNGKMEKHTVPVDVGGCTSTLAYDIESGAGDPFTHLINKKTGGFAGNGNLCEVSVNKPQ
ncbi:MAG: molybdopterin-dependent oxidoreductase [Nitrospirae bacterium]|nr:molybdopterin-dependent oxidoreductase [Nitrospirota bacterium]